MKETSERIIPSYYFTNKKLHARYIFHTRAYELMEDYVKNKKVLDLGCGEGYGSYILKEYAKEVTGVDISEEAIKEATKTHKAKNLKYQTINNIEKESLPFKDNSFDIVISFQVVEHIKNTDKYFKEINRVLKYGGTLILITPNKKVRLFSFQNPWNHHHAKEYNYREIEEEVSKYYSAYNIKGYSLKGKYLKEEIKRVNKLRVFLFPFTNFLIPSFFRKILLSFIWTFSVGRKMKQKNNKIESFNQKEIFIIEKSCVIEKYKKDSLNFICFCRNIK